MKNGEVGRVNGSTSHSPHPDYSHVKQSYGNTKEMQFYIHFPKQTGLIELQKNSF